MKGTTVLRWLLAVVLGLFLVWLPPVSATAQAQISVGVRVGGPFHGPYRFRGAFFHPGFYGRAFYRPWYGYRPAFYPRPFYRPLPAPVAYAPLPPPPPVRVPPPPVVNKKPAVVHHPVHHVSHCCCCCRC